MFTLTYINRELRRRAGRTVLTILGLAVGVGLVAAISSVSDGLDQAQADVLNPLASVGTDLMVTRPIGVANQDGSSAGPGLFGGARPSAEEIDALRREGRAVMTDLSTLGKPGSRFVHDSFLPATQLTFGQKKASRDVAALEGVEAAGLGLTLQAVHQQGTVPKITFSANVPGRAFTFRPPRLTAAQRKCIAEAGGGGVVQPGSRPEPAEPGAFAKCLPDSFRVQAPDRTVTGSVDTPQTDISSDTYIAGGVDMTTPGLALITPSQLTDGRFLGGPDADEVLLAAGYAERKGLSTGDTIEINGTDYAVVGIVKPPLGGQAADVYFPLQVLQRISNREGRANVLLVRATDAEAVAGLEEKIADAVPGAQVTSAKDVAAKVTGSLVDAANLADRLGMVLSIVLLVAAFLIATLLTLSSVAKRVRELGTLKAIGWRSGAVVRQVVGESLAQGLLGGLVGVGVGIGAAVAIAAWVPPLRATAAAASGPTAFFGLGRVASTQASETITLHAPIAAGTVLLALGLALLGGLVAGAIGALRVARLRPAEALREIG